MLNRLALVTLFTCLCTAPALVSAAEKIAWQTDLDTAWDEAVAQGRPLLVFITRDHCKFCTKMQKSTYIDEQVVEQVAEGFVPLMVDSAVEKRLVRDLKVVAYPTTVVIAPDKTVLEHIKGHVAAAEFQTRLADAQQRAASLERHEISSRRVPTKKR